MPPNSIKRPRRSWVVWEEGGQYPDLIIELLSPATAQVDHTLKKTLYAEAEATQARLQAQQAEDRAAHLAKQLKALGIDLEE
ncbi:Hypothetical Protein XM38_004380 [Halomicronema hongdechloris C2206]|uniref:Putative restriction endonuclease domain-containing protein n=1 Tax=Halomicronema hongdechloris C2206 TaxID=1641165 RepID=A0A1Z3HGV1_9CYAN|nr:Uma2 family endonuclease [Halomicronema hongdechloris]ASC69511.1 Hypothetical Protein XM38_004380 [Halomicronema hongdechloris C2206]